MPPRRAAAKPKPEPEALPEDVATDGPAVVVIEPSDQPAKKGERVVVFTCRDKSFDMPAELPVKKALKFLRLVDKQGVMLGGMEIVADLLGEKALAFLLDDPDVEDEDLTRVINAVTTRVWGVLKPAGKA